MRAEEQKEEKDYQLKTADMWSFLLFAYPQSIRSEYEIFGIIEKKLGFSTGL